MIKKIILLLLFCLFVQAVTTASENNGNNLKAGSAVTFKVNSLTDSNITTYADNNTSINRSSRNLIKLGKTLTFTGIGGFVTGSIFVGLGFIPLSLALHYSGLLYKGDYATASSNLFLSNMGNMSPIVMGMLGATLFLWAVGPLLMGLIFMIIPGIICWARGASIRRKDRRVSIAPLTDTPGISIRF